MALTYIILAAVQNHLVTSPRLRNGRQCLYDPQSQLSPLHRLAHGNILDMCTQARSAYEFPLDEDRAATDDGICGSVHDDDGVIGVGTRLQLCERRCVSARKSGHGIGGIWVK